MHSNKTIVVEQPFWLASTMNQQLNTALRQFTSNCQMRLPPNKVDLSITLIQK